MTEFTIFVLAVAILLYVLLGGADFGAGIVELVSGRRGMDTISKAIAPVWEANHVWLILAVVIIFNGFPKVFATLTTYLHIPVFIVLLGIIFRGTAFTFRYYDTANDNTHKYYTQFFRISSLLTPFFLGVTLGAIMLGRIPSHLEGTFYDAFILPWCNLFAFTTGIFLTLLFAWLAAIYLLGEAQDKQSYISFAKTARVFFVLLIASGLGVFMASELYELNFFSRFIHSPVAITCVVIATAVIPFLWCQIKRQNIFLSRFLAGVQTACILTGWFAIQFPVMVYLADGSHLTIWNSQAPERSMTMLVYALIAGILLIFPAFYYLFKVFKFSANKQNEMKSL
jgi:cytochrome d ubiquinol oxidase subunit II